MSAEQREGAIDTAIGAAIRAARRQRGLRQSDLAGHLGVTRATLASYETGRRPVLAETLVRIAWICNQPLSFFDPRRTAAAAPEPAAAPADAQQRALQALLAALQVRPDAIPITLEFVEAYLEDAA